MEIIVPRIKPVLLKKKIPLGVPLQDIRNGLVLDLDFSEIEGNRVIDQSGLARRTSLSFDGTDDYVEVPDDESLNITDAITIEAWIKTNTSGVVQVVLNKNNAYQLRVAGDLRVIGYVYTDSWHYVSSYSLIEPNIWYHIVFTYDKSLTSGNLKLYINGGEAANPVDETGTISSNAYDLLIGARLVTPVDLFNGLIDRVRIYNRALSEEEIRQLYNGKRITEGLVGEWLFEEQNGVIAHDTSGNGNNGTIHGATWKVSGRPNHGIIYGATRVNGLGSGRALSFDGEDDCVDIGITDISDLGITNELTVIVWVYPEEYKIQDIVSKNYTCFSCRLLDNQKIAFEITTENGYRGLVVGSYSLNEWIFIAYRYNGEKLTIFKNGEKLLPEKSWSGNLSDNTKPLTIGARPPHFRHFKGVIDEVRIYNRALSEEEIRQRYYYSLWKYGLIVN